MSEAEHFRREAAAMLAHADALESEGKPSTDGILSNEARETVDEYLVAANKTMAALEQSLWIAFRARWLAEGALECAAHITAGSYRAAGVSPIASGMEQAQAKLVWLEPLLEQALRNWVGNESFDLTLQREAEKGAE